ncbi:MAG: hypothetical protein Fur0012_11230 [Elusimicrobiota bacterium]
MKIEKTFYGFLIKNVWNGEMKVYRLFSSGKEYAITFMGEVICKIRLREAGQTVDTMRIIYSRNMNIPENEIADIGIMVIEAARALN